MPLPTPDEIVAFLADAPPRAGVRELARAFGLRGGDDRIALKAMLRELEDAGRLERGPGRSLQPGGLPRVTVVRVVDIAEDGTAFAVPDRWDGPGTPPRLRVVERTRRGAPGIGDRLLSRIETVNGTHKAHPMKRLEARAETLLGVLRSEAGRLWLAPVDKRARGEFRVTDPGEAQAGDLVLAEPQGRGPLTTCRVVERLGDPFAPRALSLIAIHAKRLPHVFPEAAETEAAQAAAAPLGPRDDLDLPFVTIDPADARDHDDAVWAAPGDDGHWNAVVAIADVAWFVRPGSALDREARLRGNSVYFPDRVVPMLPHALSSDACSLKAGVPRAALCCHLTIAPDGAVTTKRFTRARIRPVANIAYEDAQAQIDAQAGDHLALLTPLWGAWRALDTARARRAPLALDLPERRVVLDEAGNIAEIGVRDRLDAHRLIEEYMIAANVAAAQTLARAPFVYRCHEPPGREKLMAFKDYLATFGLTFALGQVVAPSTFNRVIERTRDLTAADEIAEQVLRTQTQAYYAPVNTGHFGLALREYGHFTSPIRRYSDLLVHRALVRTLGLGDGGLDPAEEAALARTCEHISATERRAMEAERETTDRYVARYLAERVGTVVDAKVTGVARFGVFAQVEGVGGDGIWPMSAMGDERFDFDPVARAIEGQRSGDRFTVGQRLRLRLAAADPVTGGLRFAHPDGFEAGAPERRDPRVRRGR